jgi:hypothetical protein
MNPFQSPQLYHEHFHGSEAVKFRIWSGQKASSRGCHSSGRYSEAVTDSIHASSPAIHTSRRLKRLAIAAAGLAVIAPLTTGCYNGLDASTNVQATTAAGNGVQANVGMIAIDNATLVQGPATTGTLLMRVTNQGVETDALVQASINGQPAEIVGSVVEITPSSSVSFAWDSVHYVNTIALNVPMSSYVPVELLFEKAGVVEFNALTVPPTGVYEGIAPGN